MRAALLATLALAAAVSVASAQDRPQTGSAQDAAKKNTHQQSQSTDAAQNSGTKKKAAKPYLGTFATDNLAGGTTNELKVPVPLAKLNVVLDNMSSMVTIKWEHWDPDKATSLCPGQVVLTEALAKNRHPREAEVRKRRQY